MALLAALRAVSRSASEPAPTSFRLGSWGGAGPQAPPVFFILPLPEKSLPQVPGREPARLWDRDLLAAPLSPDRREEVKPWIEAQLCVSESLKKLLRFAALLVR